MYAFDNLSSSLGSISCALVLPVCRGRHGKLVDNFSHESDVTSLQDPFTSRPYKTPFYFYYCVPHKIPRGAQLLVSTLAVYASAFRPMFPSSPCVVEIVFVKLCNFPILKPTWHVLLTLTPISVMLRFELFNPHPTNHSTCDTRRNSCSVSDGGVGAEVMKMNLATDHHAGTKYKRSKIGCVAISIALSLGHLGTRLLGLMAQSLIESPGTLHRG
jgi:hypothetical protein